VHSNNFPYLKRQKWHLIVADGATHEMVLFNTPLDFKDKKGKDCNTATFEVKQRFGKSGQFSFHAFFKCDSYVGFDKEVTLKFDVLEEDRERVIPDYSVEDMEAINGPTMVESLMAGDTTRDDESDPDEDQTEALAKKLSAAGLSNASKKVNDQGS
jgi:hypothetical protein